MRTTHPLAFAVGTVGFIVWTSQPILQAEEHVHPPGKAAHAKAAPRRRVR